MQTILSEDMLCTLLYGRDRSDVLMLSSCDGFKSFLRVNIKRIYKLTRVIENKFEAYLDNDDSPDISNPIHSTEIAQAYGFKGPLVGGATVWGWSVDTILEALGPKWLEKGWSEFSFRRPTFPGDVLRITASEVPGRKDWAIKMTNQFNEVCVEGNVGIGQHDWIKQFLRPRSMAPLPESTDKPNLILSECDVGKDWRPAKTYFNKEVAAEFNAHKQRSTNPLFTGAFPVAHPSWIGSWPEQLLRHNYDIPSSMHTRSRIQHCKKVKSDTSIVGGAKPISVYERKAHHLIKFDVLLQDDLGEDVAQIRHWTIFKIATVEERKRFS